MLHHSAWLKRVPVFCAFWASLCAFTPESAEDAPEPPKPHFLYPLEADQNVTGSFGAFRLSHHHAGLDLYAGESETIPVRAAADGTVYKLRQNDKGYGRVIYMRHENGYSTVYGHLSAFGGKLAKFAVQQEAEKGFHFEGNPKVKVKRGELLGYIGTSGTDLIHLHFEVRKDGHTVHPERNGLQLKDSQRPEIYRLFIKPRTASAHVFQSHDAKIVDLREQKAPIELGGDVELAVAIEDHMEGSSRVLQPLRFAFYIDGQLRHEVVYEQVSYATPKETELDYVAELKSNGLGFFHRLTPEGPRVSLHNKDGKRSLSDLKPGNHQAEIIATDASGNEGRAKFTLKVTKFKESTQWNYANLNKNSYFKFKSHHWFDRAVALPLPTCAEEESLQLMLLKNDKPQKKGLHVSRISSELVAVIDMPKDGGVFQLGAACGSQPPEWQQVRALAVKNKTEITDGPVRLKFGKKAFAVEFATEITATFNPGCGANCTLTPASDLYILANAWRPTQGSTEIALTPTNRAANEDGLGLYMKDGDRWWYLGRSEKDGAITGSTVHPLAFALMRDVDAPTIGDAKLESHPAGTRVIVETFDRGSGVRSASMKIDGQEAPAEWQNAYKRLVFLDLQQLHGSHKIEVTARDYAGHSTTRVQTVTWP